MRHTRVVATRYGGPDVLETIDEEAPEPGPGEARVRVKAAGVCLPDLMAREGIHPETPAAPFTPGWDLVGVVDKVGPGVDDLAPGAEVAAMPIIGGYAEYVCLPRRDLVAVPAGLDPCAAVSLVLNYITAYQMMHRSAPVAAGARVLVHGAAGGVGTALLQLGRLASLETYGTCSQRGAQAVRDLGGVPIDYRSQDFVSEVRRLAGDGVDAVYDGIGGSHLWRSRAALRRGGAVVAYGITASLVGGRLPPGVPPRRDRTLVVRSLAPYIAASWLAPGRRRIVPYSIQWRMRLDRRAFREDLTLLFGLLAARKLAPVVAERFPLRDARRAHERLGEGGVTGKIVLVTD